MANKKWTPDAPERGVSRRLFVQVTLPIASVGVLLLAIGFYGAWRVHRLHKRGADIVAENIAGIRKAEKLRATIQEICYRLNRFSTTQDESQLEEVAKLLPVVERRRQQITSQGQNGGDLPMVGQIETGVTESAAAFARLRAQTDSRMRRQEAVEIAESTVPDKILAALEEYIAHNDQQVNQSSQRNQTTANRLMFGLLLLGTCGGVTGLFLGYAIARRIGRSIVEVAVSLRDVAGKLDEAVAPVAVTSNPRIQDLESVLQIMSQRVSTVVERLQASEREALRAEQLAAMGQLAAGLAHEIRNPLTSMKTIVQLAEKPNDLTIRDLRILDEEIARLEQSIQTFLDYARPPQPEKREIALRDALEHPASLVSRRANQQGIEFHFEPPADALRVMADAAQLRQVMLNLLLNAFEATGPGGAVRLAVDCDDVEDENSLGSVQKSPGAAIPQTDFICVQVVDSGDGLPEHLGSRIFEPFVSTKDTGTGLGLSICRRIVEDHGGQITAMNHSKGGALFVVKLPLAPKNPHDALSGGRVATLE